MEKLTRRGALGALISAPLMANARPPEAVCGSSARAQAQANSNKDRFVVLFHGSMALFFRTQEKKVAVYAPDVSTHYDYRAGDFMRESKISGSYTLENLIPGADEPDEKQCVVLRHCSEPTGGFEFKVLLPYPSKIHYLRVVRMESNTPFFKTFPHGQAQPQTLPLVLAFVYEAVSALMFPVLKRGSQTVWQAPLRRWRLHVRAEHTDHSSSTIGLDETNKLLNSNLMLDHPYPKCRKPPAGYSPLDIPWEEEMGIVERGATSLPVPGDPQDCKKQTEVQTLAESRIDPLNCLPVCARC